MHVGVANQADKKVASWWLVVALLVPPRFYSASSVVFSPTIVVLPFGGTSGTFFFRDRNYIIISNIHNVYYIEYLYNSISSPR
jgi:hypothetical protein